MNRDREDTGDDFFDPYAAIEDDDNSDDEYELL
jgi:hypothetical protein